jgi:hypothetical protein
VAIGLRRQADLGNSPALEVRAHIYRIPVWPGVASFTPKLGAMALFLIAASTAGCAVVTVADAVVDVAATTVRIGAKVVETTVDVAATGVKAVAGSSDKKP